MRASPRVGAFNRAWSVAGALLCATFPAWPAYASSLVTLRFEDEWGAPIPVRAHVTDAWGDPVPGTLDPTLLSHGPLGGFFYVEGSVTLEVPSGPLHVVAGRGFEWRAAVRDVVVSGDTTLVIPLERAFDLRAQGWYSGDTHVHTRHHPLDYTVLPADLHRVARAEDLAMTWSLDQSWTFTGGAHPLSDAEATLFYTTEYRNHVYGHAALLGLDEVLPVSCCWPGVAPAPTLGDLVDDWAPGPGQGLVLSHPHNSADFWGDFDDAYGWPYNGMGRALPVLAARGRLDALDIAAYTNDPEVYVADWYDLLNCGLRVPASAGTDAALNAYASRPIGGVRTYVYEPGGHGWASWVEGLKAGRSVVTNHPLLAGVTVDGVLLGGTVHKNGPGTVTVSFDVGCTEPLTWALVIRNGVPAYSIPLAHVPPGTWEHVDVTLPISESAWLAVRVYGNAVTSHPVEPSLFAHTSPVYVHVDGEPVRVTASAGRMMDWVARLRTLVDERGNWDSSGQRNAVHAQLDEARRFYRALFRVPPGPFALRHPDVGAVLPPRQPIRLDWEDAVDPEPGDIVRYAITISTDSTFSAAGTLRFEETNSGLQLPDWLLPAGDRYWWRVSAIDRAGLTVPATGSPRRFDIDPVAVDTPGATAATLPAHAWPNPAPRDVWFELPGDAARARIRILDVRGRTILEGHAGAVPGLARVDAHRVRWDGMDGAGRRVASGRYWVAVDAGNRRDTFPLTILN